MLGGSYIQWDLIKSSLLGGSLVTLESAKTKFSRFCLTDPRGQSASLVQALPLATMVSRGKLKTLKIAQVNGSVVSPICQDM